MEPSLEITRVLVRNPGPLRFNYTVYEVTLLVDSSKIVCQRRYKDFNLFRNRIFSFSKTAFEQLPEFPPKQLRALRPSVVQFRKAQLQSWMRKLLNCPELLPHFYGFLGMSESFLQSLSYSDGDKVILELKEALERNPRNKINVLDDFTNIYFRRRRLLTDIGAYELIKILMRLAEYPLTINLAVDIIYKLCCPDTHFNHELIKQHFCKLSVEELQKLKLDCHIIKTKLHDCSVQAHELLNLLSIKYYDKMKEILNNNDEAFSKFNNWNNQIIERRASRERFKSCDNVEYRCLFNENQMTIYYKYSGKSLYIWGEVPLKGKKDSIQDWFLVPEKRKIWDLRLKEMRVDGNKIDFIYKSNRIKYVSSCSLCIIDGENSIILEFSPAEDEMSKKMYENNKIFGKIAMNFRLWNEQETDIKCTWNISLCPNTSRIYMGDLIEEECYLKESLMNLRRLCDEDTLNTYIDTEEENQILISLRRKQNSIGSRVRTESANTFSRN
ncbi:hypothetical protein SteCoe_11642 [Stentor coeruleus]|uniref:PX domain-containing protein n=1 Tax=Stentor coeruleus TaxID=5963 RepID=A0A1R2CCQ6_9CILI|nr:hypothetical protein SteCoe_11642 [Stentor coeruleus]